MYREITDKQMENMTVCFAHRYALGKVLASAEHLPVVCNRLTKIGLCRPIP